MAEPISIKSNRGRKRKEGGRDAFIVFLVYTPVNDCVLCVCACISSVVSRADMYFRWVKVI